MRRLFSIESLSTGFVVGLVFVLLGFIALLQSLYAGSVYRDHAMDAEAKTLHRVIAVASESIFEEVRQMSLELAHRLASNPAISGGVSDNQGKSIDSAARDALDVPFLSGFTNNDGLSLEKVRLYRLDGHFLAQSQRGAELPRQLPKSLAEQLHERTGIQRLQALSGLWRAPQGPLFSVIVPVGGLQLLGYLEVVVDPRFNLPDIEHLTHLPVQVVEAKADADWARVNWRHLEPGVIGVDYVLLDDSGAPAYTITSRLNVREFEQTIRYTALYLFVTHLLIAGLALIAGFALMSRYLIRPVQSMCADIQRGIETQALPPVSSNGLREFHTLASLFNRLMIDIHQNRSILENLSLTDELTGLANRRAFNAMMQREWQRCCRHGQAIALLLMDIDYFKKYNDSAGHQAGDDILRQVGRLLDDQVKRSDDLATRYGGEEFAVVLPRIERDDALAMAERIRLAVLDAHLPHPASEVSPWVSLSIGVACCVPNDPNRHDCFIECADKALYQSKAEGRNRVTFMQRSSMLHCVEECSLAQRDGNGDPSDIDT